MNETQIDNAVQGIIDDFTDRRGLSGAWDGIDDDIKEEIIETWKQIIRDAAKD